MSIPEQTSCKIRFGEFELDRETAEIRRNGTKAVIPGQPFQILTSLLDRPGQLVTRSELKKLLWPSDTFVDFDQSLNKAVNRLREVLEDSVENPRFIETLPRKGYRFIASWKRAAWPLSRPMTPIRRSRPARVCQWTALPVLLNLRPYVLI